MQQPIVAHVVRWWMVLSLALAGPVLAQGHEGVREQALTLATPTGSIAGTLALPSAAGRVPVVLIIAGSGPTDRDGNNPMMRNDSLRMVATKLAEAGFASVRYDKRGVGASFAVAPDESALRFDAYVDDAAAWVAQLKADARFSRVAVLGHSEGALIGMPAARRAGADAYVSVAGIADGIGTILRRQLAGKLTPDLAAANERILASLEGGATVTDLPGPLAGLYRPSVQPYLISEMRYRPVEQMAVMRIPVLIVQGTTDIQVGVDQAQRLKAARPDAVLAIIPGMNHVLKAVPADGGRQLASYNDPALPLAPQLMDTITGFLHGLPAAQR
jgi:pimeloyl-ACP methyl ester carboxylesterase